MPLLFQLRRYVAADKGDIVPATSIFALPQTPATSTRCRYYGAMMPPVRPAMSLRHDADAAAFAAVLRLSLRMLLIDAAWPDTSAFTDTRY